MIRGAKRQMIVLRTGDSKYFDEAYFVVRRDVGDSVADHVDLLNEANRILSESNTPLTEKKPHARLLWGFFLAGSLFGALCATLTLCASLF